MPLTLNVGLTKKIGEANYGSRGASVNFAVELEHTLVRQPDELKQKIKYLFGLAKDAVEEELAADEPSDRNDNNGHSRQSHARPATASQVRAIHAIADRNHIDLTTRLRDSFSVTKADELSVSQASELIDELKAAGNGAGGRR